MLAVNKKTDYLIVGHILDDGRQPHEGKKYQMAVKLNKKVMNENEFEAFCKIRFQNPDFLLGRKTKKDATAASEDHFISGTSNKDNIAGVMDISDLLDEGYAASKSVGAPLPNYGFSTKTCLKNKI